MANDTWIGKKDLRYYYYRFRDSEYYSIVLVGFTVVVCLFLIAQVIIPQLTNWFSIRQEIIATRERIAALQTNINFMNTVDRNALDTQLLTASAALPPEKDFGAMVDVISNAAVTSGVSLNDFSFQVGNVASSARVFSDPRYKDLASIRITLVVLGQIDGVKRFIQSVEKSIPISEVVNIDGSGQTVSVSMQFYQKSYPKLTLDATKQLVPLTAEKSTLLQKLSTMKKAAPNPPRSSSTSGTTMPLF